MPTALQSSAPCTPAKSAVVMMADDISRESTPSSSSSSYIARHNKVPAGDSPYVRAKHIQLVDKDPNKAIPLFWAAINSGDRVDSALKDMAVVMKQVNRAEEAIEAIKSFRSLCSIKAQEPLDNVLLDLYKKCGRIDDQIELLNFKLKMIDNGLAFGGRSTKLARSQGKKFHVSINQERSRLLGNLAWAYMQSENYKEAEPLYWQALAIEPDYNKQCNLAICLMQTGRLSDAKSLLRVVPKPSNNSNTESYLNSFERASEMLKEFELQSTPNGKKEEIKLQVQSIPSSANSPNLSNEFSSPSPSKYFTPQSNFGKLRWVRYEEACCSPVSVNGNLKHVTREPWTVSRSYSSGDENFETAMKSQANLKAMEYPDEDDKVKPSLLKISQAKVLGVKSDALSHGSMAMDGKRRKRAAEKHAMKDRDDRNIPVKAPNKQSSSFPSEEQAPFGSWKNGCSQICDSSLASFSESLKLKGESLASSNRRRSCSDMAKEEEEEEEEFETPSVKSKKNFETPIKNWANVEEMEYPVKNNNQKPILPIQPPTPIGISEGKASEGLRSEALSQGSMAMDGKRGKRAAEKYAMEDGANCIALAKAPIKQSCSLPSEEKVPSGSWKDGRSHSSISSSASISESSKPKGEPSILRNGRRTWADMVEEEEEEQFNTSSLLSKENFETPIRSRANLEAMECPVKHNNQKRGLPIPPPTPMRISESKAPEGLRSDALSRGSMAMDGERMKRAAEKYAIIDKANGNILVKEPNKQINSLPFEEKVPYGIWKNGCSQNSHSESSKPKGEPSLFSNGRKTWADMVEEEEEEQQLANENLNNCGLKSSVSFSKWDDPDMFGNENVNLNILRSIPQQKHQNTRDYTERICQRLNKVDPKEGFEGGGKTPTSSSSARRSLSFNLEEWSKCGMDSKPVKRGNRLRVFREITLDDSPRERREV